jgi:pyruvate-ferredoxin/flavodoxin oxidoreductase
MDLKGNPLPKQDWWTTRFKSTGEDYSYTVAHWAATEARFRRHFKKISDDEAGALLHLDDMLVRITQDDIVNRRFLDRTHRAHVPDFGVYIQADVGDGKPRTLTLSRQMVLFCVERRKSWRLLQSKAGVENLEYKAQRSLLAKVDSGKIAFDEFLANSRAAWNDELEKLKASS